MENDMGYVCVRGVGVRVGGRDRWTEHQFETGRGQTWTWSASD